MPWIGGLYTVMRRGLVCMNSGFPVAVERYCGRVRCGRFFVGFLPFVCLTDVVHVLWAALG